jgi:PBP1b-binding outer membrane lipoprotein LpoB
MKRYLNRIFAAVTLAMMISACAKPAGSTGTEEAPAEPAAEPAQAAGFIPGWKP